MVGSAKVSEFKLVLGQRQREDNYKNGVRVEV